MILKFKRAGALALTLLLLISLLAGCTEQPVTQTEDNTLQTGSTDTTGTTDTTDTTETTDPPADPTDAPEDPTDDPTDAPTEAPEDPADDPTDAPTEAPEDPTDAPTEAPTEPEDSWDWSVDPYVGMTEEEFYEDYTTATCYMDSYWRSQHYFMSGSLDVPDQYWECAQDQPMQDGVYIRNTDCRYEDDGNTYIVVDSYGREVMRIYKGGAYITLEEVAAYMYAFGGSSADLPANYSSSKNTSPSSSPWGIYLRVNHTKFSGNTTQYPYEPVLPNITGCGGDLQYYELDIGTTGTETPGYSPVLYNNGARISRGAARIVYGRNDLDGDGVYEEGEIYVFYTYNHYNDFVEYLNYYGGWGEVFGNVTGGGEYSSKTNCNPTPYVPVLLVSFQQLFG